MHNGKYRLFAHPLASYFIDYRNIHLGYCIFIYAFSFFYLLFFKQSLFQYFLLLLPATYFTYTLVENSQNKPSILNNPIKYKPLPIFCLLFANFGTTINIAFANKKRLFCNQAKVFILQLFKILLSRMNTFFLSSNDRGSDVEPSFLSLKFMPSICRATNYGLHPLKFNTIHLSFSKTNKQKKIAQRLHLKMVQPSIFSSNKQRGLQIEKKLLKRIWVNIYQCVFNVKDGSFCCVFVKMYKNLSQIFEQKEKYNEEKTMFEKLTLHRNKSSLGKGLNERHNVVLVI
ncbi:hypothetical protein RFI_04921 [Reticulomyxa filosa]|uniref:Uncharacterized protein n=1 Tax=Reticulomyxa filosa TaxID=46433 RepID=X6P0V3_RETFI|nr:hypothetical protein RFI_04921 [Reticulomyxa filosa]|eukprot:ETO32195.1 hypothetical protein RFI_04921 [Reticulomyxa filosa]